MFRLKVEDVRRAFVRCIGALMLVAAMLPLAVATAPIAEAADVEPCQVRSDRIPPPYDSNFEIDPTFVSGTGVFRLAVLFADFPDAPATSTPQEAFAQVWTSEIEDYFTAQSQGRVSIEVVADDTWRRMEHDSIDYENGAPHSINIIGEAMVEADETFDFDGIDSVLVVHEITARTSFGEYLHGPAEFPLITFSDFSVWGAVNLGGRDRFDPQTPDFDRTDMFTTHEVLHTFGLPDHYNFAARAVDDEIGQRSFVGNFGPMGELGGFAGGVLDGTLSVHNGSEVMAWHRWQLGWIDDDQVVCTTGARVEAVVSPLPVAGGVKAMMAPLDDERVVVVEARVRQGYDRDMLQDGVLVYVVDTNRSSGSGSIQVPGPYVGDWASSLDLLQPGDSKLVKGGVRVEVLSAGPQGYQVAIRYYRCLGMVPTINMTVGDSGVGTEGDDVILGTDGDDFIDGRGGNDTVCAGGGSDTVLGGEGDDIILGGNGADVLRGNAGIDTLHGEAGNDRLLGGIGGDTIWGGDGDDFLGGFGGDDALFGESGSDIIFGGFGADDIRGGHGDDVARGLIGNDNIRGGPGNDVLDGDRGNDRIEGGPGDDLIGGGNANDRLFGDDGNDSLSGGRGDDTLSGGDGTGDVCVGNKQNLADTADASCETVFGVP